jgi:hypothetical protein
VDLSTGKEQVLHKFGQGQDGSQPVAALVDVGGVLYGTTNSGGLSSCAYPDGCGVIFSFALTTSNPAYSVLYEFRGGNDGGEPHDALLYSHRAFYGTTTYGGRRGHGTGVKLRL